MTEASFSWMFYAMLYITKSKISDLDLDHGAGKNFAAATCLFWLHITSKMYFDWLEMDMAHVL